MKTSRYTRKLVIQIDDIMYLAIKKAAAQKGTSMQQFLCKLICVDLDIPEPVSSQSLEQLDEELQALIEQRVQQSKRNSPSTSPAKPKKTLAEIAAEWNED